MTEILGNNYVQRDTLIYLLTRLGVFEGKNKDNTNNNKKKKNETKLKRNYSWKWTIFSICFFFRFIFLKRKDRLSLRFSSMKQQNNNNKGLFTCRKNSWFHYVKAPPPKKNNEKIKAKQNKKTFQHILVTAEKRNHQTNPIERKEKHVPSPQPYWWKKRRCVLSSRFLGTAHEL